MRAPGPEAARALRVPAADWGAAVRSEAPAGPRGLRSRGFDTAFLGRGSSSELEMRLSGKNREQFVPFSPQVKSIFNGFVFFLILCSVSI